MLIQVLVTFLCVSSAVSQEQVPCYGEGCVNVTVYLGTRWGTRVMMVPKNPKVSIPGFNSTNGQVKTLGGEEEVAVNRVEQYDTYNRPQHRPIPQNEAYEVDFSDDDQVVQGTDKPRERLSHGPEGWRRATTRYPEFSILPTNPSYVGLRVVTDRYNMGSLDLSLRGFTGQDVKMALVTLGQESHRQVSRLNLANNMIRDLPVLVFPVEFEYGLQHLSLSDNPFNPPYLTSYSRFELSRLGKLRSLNMSQCGLRSLEMPDLPSLEFLDLSHNELQYLPRSLARLDKLQHLILRSNKLRYIYSNPLSSLSNLWVLDLGNNSLNEIIGEPFERLSSLETLKLDNNMLTTWPSVYNGRSRVVTLANNQLQCSCSLLQWVKANHYRVADVGAKGPKGSWCQKVTSGEPVRMYLQDLVEQPEHWAQDWCVEPSWGARAWASTRLWYRRNPDIMAVIYKVTAVATVVLVAFLVFRRRRKVLSKFLPYHVPYNMLDDQKVSIISEAQNHV